MEHFEQLDKLEQLSLSGYKIIRPLAAMTHLTRLELTRMPITDASAAIFERLTRITELKLEHTKVGDAVSEHVARMKNLSELNLCHTAVTDAGIKHLTACTALTSR
jgi:internalin A